PIKLSLRYYSNGQTQYFNVWFRGLIPHLESRYRETESDRVREEIDRYMLSSPCQTCHGSRLKEAARIVKINNKNIAEITKLSIDQAVEFFQSLKLTKRELTIAEKIVAEI